MALANGSLFEIRDTATTANVNGAGFNPTNANFLTNLTTNAGTGNTASPVISSASYNFVAGDVGAWVYIQAGTNWTPGFYQIASVATNKATLSAAIGAASQLNATTGLYAPSTVAGCATTGTPTGGTFGIDYSQQDTAQTTATDFASVGSSTTLTSASAAFTQMMVGNFFHQTTTGTGAFGITGWYEIVSYTNATTVTLDRTPNTGTASVACTGFVGGAGRLNGLEDAFLEMVPTGAAIYIKNGTYTTSANVTIASTNGTTASPVNIYGYATSRGVIPPATSRPTIVSGANTFIVGVNQRFFDIIFTSTNTIGFQSSTASNLVVRCKFINSSTTATRIALYTSVSSSVVGCEMVSQNGTAVSVSQSSLRMTGCYIHDSTIGISLLASATCIITDNIIAGCSSGITSTVTNTLNMYLNNTFYGQESQSGTAISLTGATSSNNTFINNIFYGWSTAISAPSLTGTNVSMTNTFFNNGTNATNWYLDLTDIFLNPTFAGASQITGTTATTSGSVLTDSGANFSGVVDNVDYVRIISGTGTTLGNYLITSHTSTTLTVNNALGTGGTADKVYFVTNGHNFAVGVNMAGAGVPGVFPGGLTTGYIDIGAVQRPNAGGSSGGSYTFVG